MKNIKKSEKYEALGFVEALISIMVVGASAIVLMQIAATTMQKMIQNERVDQMTQYAVEGAVMLQDIASRNKEEGGYLMPEMQGLKRCFLANRNVSGNYEFVKESEDIFLSYILGDDRDTYKDTAVIVDDQGEDTEFFRIICLDFPSESDSSFIIGQIVVGQTRSDGTISKGNVVADYSYYTSIRLWKR